MEEMRFMKQGETGIVVELGNEINPTVNARVHELTRHIGKECRYLIEAVVPTYRSVLVFFDPLQIARSDLIGKIRQIAATIDFTQIEERSAKVVVIPTLYGGEAGPDLEFVARHNNITVDEVVRIHSSVSYQIYMMGFTPGFPYLGGMSEKISAPRLKVPRTRIPAGSVGIAGTQTGLYPVESPGGWQLIGRTPLKVFDPKSEQPFLYQAGDFLKFHPVSPSEYDSIRRDVDRGRFFPRIQKFGEVTQ